MIKTLYGKILPAALAAVLLFAPRAFAAAPAEPQACAAPRLAETGWTDNTAATALAGAVLTAIGYRPDVKMLSVPVIFSAMSTGEIDAFLGYWQPSMRADAALYLQSGSVEFLRNNLEGARYGPAVPQYAYDAGLRSLADIARFAPQLKNKIYGVEPGNDANRILLELIDHDTDHLGQFTLVESSEQAMLAEVEAAIADKKPIVFLAWQPHPMNARFKLAYLSGGEAYFGAGENAAAVGTVARRGYAQTCPNLGRFLRNLSFAAAAENTLMEEILNQRQEPEAAAKDWLKTHSAVLAAWLDGVKTAQGAPALPAAKTALGMAD